MGESRDNNQQIIVLPHFGKLGAWSSHKHPRQPAVVLPVICTAAGITSNALYSSVLVSLKKKTEWKCVFNAHFAKNTVQMEFEKLTECSSCETFPPTSVP